MKAKLGASKGWWSMTRRLLGQRGKLCSIPALRKPTGEWCRNAKAKADHLAETFKMKCSMKQAVRNHYANIEAPSYKGQNSIAEPSEQMAEHFLESLRADSGTGPDLVPARILKECANVLSKPFSQLAKRILAEGRWPETWIEHWIVPLHKRKNVYLAGNYRGVHLTAQLSKAMERLLRSLFRPFVLKNTS